MKLGINLGGVADYATDNPYIDRLRMAQAPAPIAKGVPMPPFDPVTGFPLAAGQLNRQIGLDPASVDNPRTYVLLCDENVSSVQTVWGKMIPKDGRATIKVTSSAGGVGLGITATGPVKRLAFLRVEHEEAYQAGEIFNPEYLARIAPFPLLRTLDYNATNYEPAAGITSFPPRRPLPTDGFFSVDRGGLPAEHIAMLAKKTGADVWYPLHHLMPDNDIAERIKVFVAAGVPLRLEDSNEFGWTYHRAWALAQAAAHSATSKPSYADVLRFYGWRSAQIGKLAAAISPDVKINLASQASDGVSNLPAILKGWDETGAPRSLITGYANASYLNLNGIIPALLAAMAKDDKEAFYTAVEGLMPALQARHVKAGAACKAAGVDYKIYEGGLSLYTNRPAMTDDVARKALLDWALPLLHSDRAADIEMRMIQGAFDAGATEFCHFQLSGPGSQYGIWGTMPHITQAPYPIYDMLVKANAATKADPYTVLAARVADMQKQLAELAGDIASLAVG